MTCSESDRVFSSVNRSISRTRKVLTTPYKQARRCQFYTNPQNKLHEVPRRRARSEYRSINHNHNCGFSSSGRLHEDLPLEWWERSEGCKEAKFHHTRMIDYFCSSREDLVLLTTLWKSSIALEPNMFPCKQPEIFIVLWYSIDGDFPDATPSCIEHYTLWSIKNLTHVEVSFVFDTLLKLPLAVATHSQIVAYVDNWLNKNMPQVRRWQYDDNAGDRSILLFHVHVYIETIPFAFTPRSGNEYFPPHCKLISA